MHTNDRSIQVEILRGPLARRTLWSLSCAALIVLGGCGPDSTGLDSSCEIIYATSDPPGASGIEVHNATGGGLSVQVDGGGFPGAGANMDAGACEVWAYPPGAYQVALQRCEQANPGESTCTSLLGSEAIRSVTVQGGSRTVLQVDASFFP